MKPATYPRLSQARTALLAALLALPIATTQATNYYFDVTSGTVGFGSPSGSYSWNNASPRYWTTDSTGAGANVTPAAAYGSLDGWIFGSSSSDLAGTSFTITGSGTGVNGITINSASCHVTLSGAVNIIPSNAANTPQTWYVAAGSTLTEALTFNTYGMNMGSNKITLAGGGTINFNTTLGYNRPSAGAGIDVNGDSTLVVNLKAAAPTTLGAPASTGFQDGLTLTAGKLNFATAASADAFKGFVTAAKPFAIKGGTLDNTSGAAMTLTVGSAGVSLGGDFTFAGSSDLDLGTAKMVLTGTRQITVTQNNLTVGGIISGSTYGLTKAGAGTLTLSNANTYGGETHVDGGTLLLNGANTGGGLVTVAENALLGGNGSTTSAITLNTGGKLIVDISDWNGAAGSGFTDLTAASLTLPSGSLPDGAWTLHISSTTAFANFAESGNKTFAFLSTSSGISNFNPANVTLEASGFPGIGTWSIQKNLNTLELVYTAGSTASFTKWANDFSSPTLSNKSEAADPDGDGLANALEYVFGTDPRYSNPGNFTSTVSGDNLVVTFARTDNSETPDITLAVEVSTDLSDWTSLPHYTIGATTATSDAGVVVEENDTADDTITVTIPKDGSVKRFARLKAAVTTP